jgi:hypothetical protein
MTLDPVQVRQYAPYLAPVLIVGFGWLVLVRPLSNENASMARELTQLRQRSDAVRAQMGAPPPPAPPGDPVRAFEGRVAEGDASGRLLEELSRLASRTGLRVDTIETGEEAVVGGRSGGSAVAIDPRFGLFQAPLKYSPVTLSADADYASLGAFLWQLRETATMIEVRSLEVRAPLVGSNQTPVPPGTLRVVLTMFAYARAPRANPGPGAGV